MNKKTVFKIEVNNFGYTKEDVEKIAEKLKQIDFGGDIELKVQEIDVQEIEPDDIFVPGKQYADYSHLHNNRTLVNILNLKVEKKNKLAGRFLSFPFADGCAIYQIHKVIGDTVYVQVVSEIGDDWAIPDIGESGTITLDRAMRYLMRTKELFGHK